MTRWSWCLLAVLTACGAQKTPTYEQDIKPLMEASCVSCHVEGGIAPFALTSFEQVAAQKGAIAAAVTDRRMPPYLAGEGCTDYADDQRLSTEQIALINAWVSGGAPRGTPSATSSQPPARLTTLPRVDREMKMPVAYTPMTSPDDYRCFVLDWPEQVEKYVTGFYVTPGNARVVHHVIAFLIQPDQVQQIDALDAAEAGPGYTCFGGPGVTSTISWLGSWAPGSQPAMYPDGTGLLVKPGSKVVMQVHYNTTAAPEGQRTDQTKLEVALSDTVDKRAWILPWASVEWVRRHNMPIPAGAPDVVHSWAFDPTQFLGNLTSNQLSNGSGFRMYTAGLHQHLLGTSGKLTINHPDGTSECLLDVPRWDFHWQRSYRFAKTKAFKPGDQLGITCHWDNSAANQPLLNGVKAEPRDVNWGEGTTDEMCLGLFYISE
ncbi:MAG: monooxygenase [Myxococcota bacterium]